MPLTKAQAKSLDILEVARSLGMEMKRKSHREYYWAEHDSFKIDTVKNTWNWYSQADKYGDTINLVQEMRNVSYKEAMVFLETGSFPEAKPVEEERQPFNYTLAPYEQRFVEARSYLKEIRGLSDDTIDFFLEKGVLAQAKRKDKDGVIEDVLVFKYLDRNQQLVGASLQGLVPDQERHPGKGYLKQIMYQSESISGLNVSIGSPKRLIVTEAPIDLMSYYELHKGELNDVRLVAMEGLKEGVLSHYVLEMLQERGEIAMDERDYSKSSELSRTSRFLSVAAETSTLFQDYKYDDLITLAVDHDKAGTDFITKLREKKIPVVDARPPKREGQEKTDWNEILKQEKQLEREVPDNSRLAQARRKLERLKGEQDEAISRAYSHQALTNGQPINDKRGGANFMRKQEQIEDQVFSKMDEIRKQEERVERLEHQQHLKEMGLNRQGSGLEMSVQNIPRIREELEKAKRGESFFTKATLKRYQEELTRLEAISEQMGKTSIQPATQALIDEGLVNQWKKQPNTYFVKGLRRVALELNEEGEFQLSSQTKYHPKTDEERLKVEELLKRQKQGSEVVQITSESFSTNTETKLEVTNTEVASDRELFVVFDFTENPRLSKKFSSGDVVSYQDFISQLYEENDWLMLSQGYDKTYFALQDERGNRLTDDFRYDIGSERSDLSVQLGNHLTSPYLELAQKADHDYRAQVSYSTFKSDLKNLTDAVQSQIQAGIVNISLSDEVYFYTLVNYTGWSHPMQQLKPEALEKLKEYRPFFESINDTNIDRFKEKGTSEQNQMYDILKGIQKELGRSNTSTVFSEEVAISAYNLNRRMNSLTAENWGKAFADPLGNLGQDTWKNLSYPANELETINHDYDFQLVSYHLLEHLNGKRGTVEISPETYEMILQRLREEDIIIVSEEIQDERLAQREVEEKATQMSQIEKSPDHNQETEKLSEQQKNERTSQYKGYLQPEAEGSTSPVLETSTFERSVTSRPTTSSQYLNFTIKGGHKSSKTRKYHSINRYDLSKLNRRGHDIQEAAQFYRDHLANSRVNYFTSDGNIVQVNFLEENFMHLTGLKIISEGVTPEQILHDFANGGNVSYDDIRLGNNDSPLDKIKVLPDLEAVLKTDSFYFNHLQEIPRYEGRFDSLIKADDKDIMLLFRDTEKNGRVPVSVFKVRPVLNKELEAAKKNIILGIYRERDGEIEQLSINEDYIKDDGKKMMQILNNRQYETVKPAQGNTLSSVEHLESLTSQLDISQLSYALEDVPYADQLLSQLPYGELENSPIGFTESSHDNRLGFVSFDGMDSVEIENLSALFERLGVQDSPQEQVALVEKWQKEIETLSEKVEQIISKVRDEYEKVEEEEIKLEEQGYNNNQELKQDADADGIPDDEELLQGTNPYDFRSKPDSKPETEESQQVEEVALATSSLAVANFIQNKDIAGLNRYLKVGIKEFLDSDKYKNYLTKMSQLNNYSSHNLRLILAQNPEARQVASFKQWKENFGRYVKKGEKALRIFKPMTKIKKDENNQPILDKNGKPETVTFFGLVPVFDVSQTDGKEMPKAAEVKEQLTDLDYANLYRALMAIAKENDISVRFEEMENNKQGYYSVPENQIVLRSNEMNKAQIIKTFLHEMAHAELHHADNPQKENLTRSTAELQAESVAYVISSYYGIDTSEYSFNYLSGWSADKETLADLEAQLDIVQQEAKSLMVRMDQALEQLRLSQEKQTKRSFEQKLEKFKDQSKQAVEDHKHELKADAQSKKEKGFSK